MRHQCRARHLALSTERQYVQWIRRYILFHNKRHPLEMGKTEVSAFLTHLAVEGNVAASTQNQALAALLFLYRNVLERDFGWLEDVVRAKKPKRLPVVYSVEEASSTSGRCGKVLAGWNCRTRWSGNIPVRRASGAGSTCFRPRSRRATRGAVPGGVIIWTPRFCKRRCGPRGGS